MSVEEAKKELAFEIPKLHAVSAVRALEEEKPNTFEVRSPLASSRPAPQEEQEDAFEENKKYLLEREKQAKQQKIDPSTLIFRGVLFETYLIFERGDEAYFIDQHAAHERLIYEKLKNKCEARTPLSSPCSCPISSQSTRRIFLPHLAVRGSPRPRVRHRRIRRHLRQSLCGAARSLRHGYRGVLPRSALLDGIAPRHPSFRYRPR